jgi:ribosome maturation factor RimP
LPAPTPKNRVMLRRSGIGRRGLHGPHSFGMKIGVFFLESMERGELLDRLWKLLEPVVESRGLELLEVEFQRETRGWVLRLYIDREEGGVTLDDCTAVSREVGDLLDVKDPIDHPYHLEVSSPGLDRPLRRPKDFQRWAGHRVRIMVSGPRKKTIQGVLSGLQDETVEIETALGPQRVPLKEIAKARLVYEWPKGMGIKE